MENFLKVNHRYPWGLPDPENLPIEVEFQAKNISLLRRCWPARARLRKSRLGSEPVVSWIYNV